MAWRRLKSLYFSQNSQKLLPLYRTGDISLIDDIVKERKVADQQQPVVVVQQAPVMGVNPLSGIVKIAGLAVGLAAGYYTHGLLDGMLPEATTAFERVARGAAIYGGSIAVEQVVSGAVVKSLDGFSGIPAQVMANYEATKAAVPQQITQ